MNSSAGHPVADGAPSDGWKVLPAVSKITDFIDEFRCPICKDIMVEPFATECGHTFCHGCIRTHLGNRKKCPCCSTFLTEKSVHPVFALEKMVASASHLAAAEAAPPVDKLKLLLSSTPELQTCADIDELIDVLKQRRLGLGQDLQEINLHLLLLFLQRAKSEMLKKAQHVKAQMECVGTDIARVKRKREELKVPGLPPASNAPSSAVPSTSMSVASASEPTPSDLPTATHRNADALNVPASSYANGHAAHGPVGNDIQQLVRLDVGNAREQAGASTSTAADVQLEALTSKLIAKKKCVVTQFNEFQALYLKMCCSGKPQEGNADRAASLRTAALEREPDALMPSANGSLDGTRALTDDNGAEDKLSDFGLMLATATQYVELRKIGEMQPAREAGARASSLSSIDFSSDQQMFAVGGHSQPIKIYNYDAVLSAGPQVHKPCQEVAGCPKVSCLSWSHGTKEHLLNSGSPDGAVVLWNVATAQELCSFTGHSKRVWSVHFSPRDPLKFVSGSDDCSVKVWSANCREPVISIDMGYNVCCTQFGPDDGNTIAVGTAGHTVSVYDLRQPLQPLALLHGHRKAVSYVKFMTGKQVVSSSVDNSLSLWDIPSASLVRSFSGHINKKNFVGMSVNGNYIACGSEASQVHVYYKQVCQPILDYSFPVALGSEATTCFTSAVTWKPNSTHLLAANSLGSVTILSMTD